MQQIIDKFLAFITVELLLAFLMSMVLIVVVVTVYYFWKLKPKIDKANAQKDKPQIVGKGYKLKNK